MAGFFGLFNYEKEGPGIEKDAPKKKGFVVFFETFFRNFWKFITINLVYVLLSVPMVTTGLTSCGLTHVARNTARDKHSFGLSDFFETIKKNWKQSLVAGILNIIITVLLFWITNFYYGQYDETGNFVHLVGLGLSLSLTLIFIFMKFYLWTLVITFNLTLKQIYKNSFKFVFINFKGNLLCGICLLAVYAFYIAIILVVPYFIVWTIAALLAVCTLPAFRFLLIQYFVFPSIKKHMIDPYYEEHPDDDIELRRNLGLDVEETTNMAEEVEDEEEEIEETEIPKPLYLYSDLPEGVTPTFEKDE